MSLEGILADAENVEVFYLKETISFNEIQERESVVWETAVLYKFYFRLDRPCKLYIYLPFSLQGSIEWKQENIRSKEYQTKVAYTTEFELVEDDIFHIRFYEEMGEFNAFLPSNEEMQGITTATSKQVGERTSSLVTIDVSALNLPEDFFQVKKCGLGFMLKVRTREFLTKENMKKLTEHGQIWSFNIKLYPVTSSLTGDERQGLINLHDADIWAILPENSTIFHLNPPPRVVLMMEEADEETEDAYASMIGPYKTYKAGQIAICWDLKNLKNEVIIHYIGQSPLEVRRSDIREIWEKTEEIGSLVKGMDDQLRVFDERIDDMKNEFLKELKQYVTTRDMFTIVGLLIALITVFTTLVLLS